MEFHVLKLNMQETEELNLELLINNNNLIINYIKMSAIGGHFLL